MDSQLLTPDEQGYRTLVAQHNRSDPPKGLCSTIYGLRFELWKLDFCVCRRARLDGDVLIGHFIVTFKCCMSIKFITANDIHKILIFFGIKKYCCSEVAKGTVYLGKLRENTNKPLNGITTLVDRS